MKALPAYLETLTLTGGDCDGQQFQVLPWERKFIAGAFGQSGDSALSIARGNGKSALVAAIATAVVDPDGPLHGNRREVVIAASSFDQGKIIFEDCLAFLRGLGHELTSRATWKVENSANKARIEHLPSGARLKCIGSDPKRAHGLRPFLALLDEPAQWPPNTRDKFFAAVKTGLGKVPGSRLVALGTRSSDPLHWFSRLLDGRAGYAQQHFAPDDGNPLTMKNVKLANPSLPVLPSLKAQIRLEMSEARRDSGVLASFRALRLNQGVSDIERQSLLEASSWTGCEVNAGEVAGAGAYVLGIDLGGGRAMSAAAAMWPSTGRLEAIALFPSEPGLTERGLMDGVGDLYLRMNERGELVTRPGAWVPVAELLREVERRWGFPACVVADRWREKELRQSLKDSGFPLCRLELRGQGYKDGAEDVRAFREAILTGRVSPVKSLLLRSAMAEAVTVCDPAGNEKLAKSSEGGRRFNAKDDAVAAAILAVSAATRLKPPKPAPRLRFAVVGGS